MQTIFYFKVFGIGSWHFTCAITWKRSRQIKRTGREHCVHCALPSCIFGFISHGTNRYCGYFSLKYGSLISAWWSSVIFNSSFPCPAKSLFKEASTENIEKLDLCRCRNKAKCHGALKAFGKWAEYVTSCSQAEWNWLLFPDYEVRIYHNM